MPDRATHQPQQSQSHSLIALRDEHAETCCLLEAKAFNRLRVAWGQPEQRPRRLGWMQRHIRTCPHNNLVALFGDEVIGFSLTHHWGSLGWLGPIVVAPGWQGHGLGLEMAARSRMILEEQGCQTIALETWPHYPPNIALYVKTGFAPHDLILILEKRLTANGETITAQWLSQTEQRAALSDSLADLSASLLPGLDYRPLLDYTLACQLGDVAVWGPDRSPDAAAVVHLESYSQAPTPAYASVELLMVRPGLELQLDQYLRELEAIATREWRHSIRLAVPGSQPGVLGHLVGECGWRVVKTRLRMTSRYQAAAADSVNCVSYAI